MRPLERSFYERNTRIVAFELIGKILVFSQNETVVGGKIVETEAYFGSQDQASHAYRGPTPRNRVMFGPPGMSYVYFTYGNHHCLNIVTEKEEIPGAVLIRAVAPQSGVPLMRKRRGNVEDAHLTNGPGKLTQAFGITSAHSGLDLTQGPLCVAGVPEEKLLHIRVAKRIGISRAKESLLRFYLEDSPFVSRRTKSLN